MTAACRAAASLPSPTRAAMIRGRCADGKKRSPATPSLKPGDPRPKPLDSCRGLGGEPRTARAQAVAGAGSVRGSGDVKAAIPGRVLRLLVSPGDEVQRGQPVVVLEAMKMENDVRAPRDGVVASVEVAAGQPVGAGQLLLRLEPAV